MTSKLSDFQIIKKLGKCYFFQAFNNLSINTSITKLLKSIRKPNFKRRATKLLTIDSP